MMDYFYHLVGNFGVAILLTTIVVKVLFFPLASKQYASMANMKRVQPKLEELKTKYADDRMGLQQAMMALYKEEKINPVAGCWPVLLQIPVFLPSTRSSTLPSKCATRRSSAGSRTSRLRIRRASSTCSACFPSMLRPSCISVSGRSSWASPCGCRCA